MKQLFALISLLLIFSTSAKISSTELVSLTNNFMANNCDQIDLATAMPGVEMQGQITDYTYVVSYSTGWAKVGVNDRPPHDDSGQVVESDFVVLKFSCKKD